MMLGFRRKKFIYDHLDYTISEDAVVVNEKNGKVIKGYERDGYILFDIPKDGKQIQYRLHLVVADHFVPNPNNYDWINFKDRDYKNCKAENLRWVVRPDHSKKYIKQYTLSGIFVKEYPSLSTASEQTNIDIGNISSCCEGKRRNAGGFKWQYTNKKNDKQVKW